MSDLINKYQKIFTNWCSESCLSKSDARECLQQCGPTTGPHGLQTEFLGLQPFSVLIVVCVCVCYRRSFITSVNKNIQN